MRRGADLPASPSASGGVDASVARTIWPWTAALVVLCAGSLWLRFDHIASTLPYPLHGDEGRLARSAAWILASGRLDPHGLGYPSLPKYLTAAGMAFGFLRGAANGGIQDVRQIGVVGFPYYDTPRAVQGARQLFAFLSVVALGACGYAAWLTFRRPAVILLAPLVLSASPLFFAHSWTYLNVDIVGACFVTLTMAACLRATAEPSITRSALVPGLLAGLAAGSKYTLGVVIVPVVLGIALYVERGRRPLACLAAVCAMAVAFVLVVPYCLLDIPAFLNWLALDASHYANGHTGFDGDPGLPQLLHYGRDFVSELGIAGAALGLGGAFAYAVRDWRRAGLLLALPATLMWLLAAHRVHFTRNVLSLFPIAAMFVAYGIVWLLDLAVRGLRRRWNERRARIGAALSASLLIGAAIPLPHLVDQLRDRTDSRTLAQSWIQARVPPGWSVVVPRELEIDTRTLEAAGRPVRIVDLGAAVETRGLRRMLGDVQLPAVVLLPRWGADGRFAGEPRARELNDATPRWRIVARFGSNPVLVNYPHPNPSGDPAFAIALLDGRRAP